MMKKTCVTQQHRHTYTMANTSIRVISTSTILAAESQHNNNQEYSILELPLTPWDLQLLLLDPIQKGLLFHNNPKTPPPSSIINHLKTSLSSTLTFFPPLSGRLKLTEQSHSTCSVSILCNNSGAQFVHAVADNCSVKDITGAAYTPRIVHSFFPLNRVRNYEATTKPLLAVQVTELVDGIFIGLTMNHTVADGTSFWHFINSWAQISRGSQQISKLPVIERWFPEDVNSSIQIPFTKEKLQNGYNGSVSEVKLDRFFHFKKEKIAELKTKATKEASAVGGESGNRISSLQTVLTHIWRSVVRNQGIGPQEEVNYRLLVGVRGRIKSPLLHPNYFGNAVNGDELVTMKASELLEEGGIGRGALEMSKMVAKHTEEKIKREYKAWVKRPRLVTEGGMAGNALVSGSSPRFDVYGNDFGWGRPVAVRSGVGNKSHGKISVFEGVEDGSIDVEVCLSYHILEAMANDRQFMDAIST